ncbi:MAG: Na+/H+ antiporter NhaA [Hyphomonadaceae bacterium]|nr:Na+/H+ antiporter NhaA [Hyphomonadaceae bacterium]
MKPQRQAGSGALQFLKTEAGGGMLLVAAAAAAMIVANSAWSQAYFNILAMPLVLDLGVWRVDATLKDWVKDGLMAVFFYVIGLELKRELTVGELSNPKTFALPVAAAIGGAALPALFYLLMAGATEPRAWPVPVATDIAFALAALSILAPKVDPRVRLFLLTLAVVDDLMAIVLIALLFTSDLAIVPLVGAIALLLTIWALGRRRSLPIWIYLATALVSWALAKESGVHTSVMAVAAAMAVSPKLASNGASMIGKLEHAIHPVSAFIVLPIFAFCAAGISLAGLQLQQVTSGASAAIALALALGKPLGVALFAMAAVRLLQAPLPFSVREVVGVGCLCGIGFTMSLFIAGLAFAGDGAGEDAARLGVLMGSGLSLVMAAAVFRLWPNSNVSARER